MQVDSSLNLYVGMIRELCETLDGTRYHGRAYDTLGKCYEALVDLEMELDSN